MRYVYQSPKSKMRSAPVDESEKGRIAILEAAGWKIVETLDAAPVVVVERPEAVITGEKNTASLVGRPLPDRGADLPEDFPCRDLLLDQGYDNLDDVQRALPMLHTLKGFGPARSAAVRAYFDPSEV